MADQGAKVIKISTHPNYRTRAQRAKEEAAKIKAELDWAREVLRVAKEELDRQRD